MSMYRILLFLIMILPLHATETLLLPIKLHINMRVEIPKEFKPMESLEAFSKPETISLEFIPENQDITDWTEIITVQKFIGRQISAENLTKLVRDRLLAITTNGKILSEINSDKNGYEQSSGTFQYEYARSLEVIGMQYNSGPDDCVGVQYTVRIKDADQADAALKKIDNFFKTNTSIIVDTN